MAGILDVPDAPDWRHLPDYSDDVAAYLSRAHHHLARPNPSDADSIHAALIVSPLPVRRMAAPQRLNVNYLLAKGFAALEEYDLCLEQIDLALNSATFLEDFAALSTLHSLRACALRAMLHYRAAAGEYRRSLALLVSSARQGYPVNPLREANLLTWEATSNFYFGEYETAQRLLDGARMRLPLGAEVSLEAATILWIQCLIDRWRGNLEQALPAAQRAAEVYMRAGPSASGVRIQTVIAELELDLAEVSPIGSSMHAFRLGNAASHLVVARRLATKVSDDNGDILIRLIDARVSRMRGDNVGRTALIQTLAQDGRRLRDDTLVSRAYTTLGDELMVRGEESSALNCYRHVLDMLAGGDLAALSLWARQAYHRHQEYHL